MGHKPAQPFIWSLTPRNATCFAKYGTEQTISFSLIFSLVFCCRRANGPHMLVHDGHSSYCSKHSFVVGSKSSSIQCMLCIVSHEISTALPTRNVMKRYSRSIRILAKSGHAVHSFAWFRLLASDCCPHWHPFLFRAVLSGDVRLTCRIAWELYECE